MGSFPFPCFLSRYPLPFFTFLSFNFLCSPRFFYVSKMSTGSRQALNMYLSSGEIAALHQACTENGRHTKSVIYFLRKKLAIYSNRRWWIVDVQVRKKRKITTKVGCTEREKSCIYFWEKRGGRRGGRRHAMS